MTESTSKKRWYLDPVPAGVVADGSYRFEAGESREIAHAFSDKVHLSSNPMLNAYAARISHEGTEQPLLNDMIRMIFLMLMVDGLRGFPRKLVAVKTPMAEKEKLAGYWAGEIADPETRVVIADVIRAGSVPSEAVYGAMTTIINPDCVRKDVFIMSRKTDAAGKVTGTDCSGSKIGGTIANSVLIIPEPMVATGGTISQLLDLYKSMDLGMPQMVIVLAMIITPEAIRRITKAHPEVIIHAARLDRGKSAPGVRDHMPGMNAAHERGLREEDQYIVPGAGGLGERQTGSWV